MASTVAPLLLLLVAPALWLLVYRILTRGVDEEDAEFAAKYAAHLARYRKSYDGATLLRRYQHYKNTMKMISSNPNLAENFLADLFPEEMDTLSNAISPLADNISVNSSDVAPVYDVNDAILETPELSDFRLHSRVNLSAARKQLRSRMDTSRFTQLVFWKTSGVHFQGSCRASGVSSAVSVIEAAYHQKYRVIKSLSVQDPLDCMPVSRGCAENRPDQVLAYAKDKGICDEPSYRYVYRKQADCFNEGCAERLKIRSASGFPLPVVTILQRIREGPFTMIVKTGKIFAFWSPYADPIHGTECDGPEHAVAAVGLGYDRKLRVYYLTIQNSWGPGWGDVGYGRFLLDGKNSCDINKGIGYNAQF